jgi:hypothetical protein
MPDVTIAMLFGMFWGALCYWVIARAVEHPHKFENHLLKKEIEVLKMVLDAFVKQKAAANEKAEDTKED